MFYLRNLVFFLFSICKIQIRIYKKFMPARIYNLIMRNIFIFCLAPGRGGKNTNFTLYPETADLNGQRREKSVLDKAMGRLSCLHMQKML